MSELFLKDEKVLTFKDIDGAPGEILKIDNPELLPISLRENCTMDSVRAWMKNRSIPENREGLKEMINKFGKTWLRNKNYASLSDSYWIKRRTENWRKINFYTNLYSKHVGDMAFKPWNVQAKRYDDAHASPDLTTNGILKKRWTQEQQNRVSYLLKAGSKATHQEPLNEVLVAALAEQLGGFKCVEYDLCVEGTTMCSRGENFCTEDIMLVPAHELYYSVKKEDNETTYKHLVNVCELYDVPDAEDYLNWVIFIDSLTANEDRNLSNIGFLYDITQMRFIGPAPLYDCGNAYWNTKKVNDAVKSKLFGDIEVINYKKMLKKYNIDFMSKDYGYKKLIQVYPDITEVKKENLIEAISIRNNKITKVNSFDDIQL